MLQFIKSLFSKPEPLFVIETPYSSLKNVDVTGVAQFRDMALTANYEYRIRPQGKGEAAP